MGSSLNGRSVILLHTIVHSSFALFSKFRYVSILCSCCTIFMLHILGVAFFSYFAFSIMHLSDLALFSRCTFFGCSFRCSLFSFCTFFVLYSLCVALSSCFTSSVWHSFHVLLFLSLFMFSLCYFFFILHFSVLHSFNISLFLLLFMFSLSYTCFSYTLTLRTLPFHGALSWCFTLFVLHLFSYCIRFMLDSFYVGFFPCETIFMFLFCVALFSCCAFFVLRCHQWTF